MHSAFKSLVEMRIIITVMNMNKNPIELMTTMLNIYLTVSHMGANVGTHGHGTINNINIKLYGIICANFSQTVCNSRVQQQFNSKMTGAKSLILSIVQLVPLSFGRQLIDSS